MHVGAPAVLFVSVLSATVIGCSPPMQENVRVKAANEMACDQGHVEVEETDSQSAGPNAPILSPDKRMYIARGCGKVARYACDFAKATCEKIE